MNFVSMVITRLTKISEVPYPTPQTKSCAMAMLPFSKHGVTFANKISSFSNKLYPELNISGNPPALPGDY